MESESTTPPQPCADPSAPGPVATSATTYAQMRELLAAAILRTGERQLGPGAVTVIADLARVAMRLEMKAISNARQAPKHTFAATFNSVYATERADLCNAVSAVYGGQMSVAVARALLMRIRAEIPRRA